MKPLIEIFIGAPNYSNFVEIIFVQNTEEFDDIATSQKLMLDKIQRQLDLLVVIPFEKSPFFILQRFGNMRL